MTNWHHCHLRSTREVSTKLRLEAFECVKNIVNGIFVFTVHRALFFLPTHKLCNDFYAKLAKEGD
jgi:hypothetical protein